MSLEATGIYSLDLALALDAAEQIEVAVLNPKVVNRFAQTLRRSRPTAADAWVLSEYSRRMAFTAWRAPDRNGLQLRTISRHIDGLSVEHTREQNRLHAAQGSTAAPRCVVQDSEALAGFAGAAHGKTAARGHGADSTRRNACERQFDLMISIPGIAEISALQVLGETGPAVAGAVGAAVGGPQRSRSGA